MRSRGEQNQFKSKTIKPKKNISVTINDNKLSKKIYTVSELTAEIKVIIEESLPFVWVFGEISNLKTPSSGHFYFTLKDKNAQIKAVMFRGQTRNLKFRLKDGMAITGLGRLNLYEPHGTYQVIFEYIEPKGTGALQAAYEQLKTKLFNEGLFKKDHKRPIPFLPAKISMITSPTGSVIHDMLNIIDRRFPNMAVEIWPVKVQGQDAEAQIASALQTLNRRTDTDLIIIARGGGSLEDLQAFNSETVARAVFKSQIPVISAVGHETDFTICDFVSDLRAPTPSTAAELAVPIKNELHLRCRELSIALSTKMQLRINRLRVQLDNSVDRLRDPVRNIQDLRLKTDDYTMRLDRSFIRYIQRYQERLAWRTEKLGLNNPLGLIEKHVKKLEQIRISASSYIKKDLSCKKSMLGEMSARLYALNPIEILSRGYSITRTIPNTCVITDSNNVSMGQELEIILANGSLRVAVKGKTING
ncbi:MAG: exodeoxyribonuclease VII large subunit [Deltaproteobacteria bacterium]|nr:exodeoxyribonuclease VII large subunit [Deltaproteobacteria bacterium]